eukprot:scaffold1038_cov122-Isochrysis_galbana.AAC.1
MPLREASHREEVERVLTRADRRRATAGRATGASEPDNSGGAAGTRLAHLKALYAANLRRAWG